NEEGMQRINLGEHAQALAKFEASLRCKEDPYTRQLAFMSACSAKDAAKAQQLYPTLTPAQQTKFKQICIRNGIDYDGDDAGCDAEALKEQGMEHISMGEHSKALAKLE